LLTKTGTLSFTIDGDIVQQLDSKGRGGTEGTQEMLEGSFAPGGTFWKDVTKGIDIMKGLQNASNTPVTDDLSYLPGIGAFLKAVDFMTGIFGPSRPKSITPITFKATLKASGTLTYESPYRPIPLVTPGSAQNSVVSTAIPFYNNAPGVFNLLKSPKIKRLYNSRKTTRQEIQEASYQLMEDIKYVINPNAGLSQNPGDISITAQFVFLKDDDTFETIESEKYNLACFPQLIHKTTFKRTKDGSRWESWDDEEGGKVFVKIVGKFKAFPSGEDVLYSAIYLPEIIFERVYDPALIINSFPISNCNDYLPPANSLEIKSVCNSKKYKDKASIIAMSAPEVPDSLVKESKDSSIQFRVFPNPTNGNFVLSFYSKNTDRISLSIINGFGVVSYSSSFDVNKGENRIPLQISLPAGQYFVKLVAGNEFKVEKLVIL
jgi:hypothetical protein